MTSREWIKCAINLLLTEREGRTGEYWPEVVAVRTERSEVGTKTTEGQYSPVRLELATLVSSLLYGTRAMLVLNFPFFENKKYTAYDRFHGNGPYGEISTKKEPIRTLGFALPYNKGFYCEYPRIYIFCISLPCKRQLIYLYSLFGRPCTCVKVMDMLFFGVFSASLIHQVPIDSFST